MGIAIVSKQLNNYYLVIKQLKNSYLVNKQQTKHLVS